MSNVPEHVQAWHKADKLRSSRPPSEGERRINALMDKWFNLQWSTMINGVEVVGKLRQIDDYKFFSGEHIEAVFTIEFDDPDNPGYPMSITRHFAQFKPV